MVFAVALSFDINTHLVKGQSGPVLTITATGDVSCEPQGLKTINAIEEMEPNKVLWLGDLSYIEGDLDCFFDEQDQLNVSNVLAVIGNHDDREDEDRVALIEKYKLPDEGYYNRTWDVPNTNQSNDVLVIGMNTEDPNTEDPSEGNSSQFEFIEKVLKDNTNLEKPAPLVIVMMHKPMVTCECEHPRDDSDKVTDAPRYHRIFKQNGVDLVLQGHNHNVQYYEPKDGVKYIVSGAGGREKHSVPNNNDRFPHSGTGISGFTIGYKNDDTSGFTFLEANFDTSELKGKLISNNGNPEGNSDFTMQFAPSTPPSTHFSESIGSGIATFIPSDNSLPTQNVTVHNGTVMLPRQ